METPSKMGITIEELSRKIGGDNWQAKEEEVYSSNDVINAYLQGKEDQKNATTKILMEKFESNLKLAFKTSSDFFQELQSVDLRVRTVYLRFEEITKFDALYVVSNEDFLSEKFDSVYKLSFKKKDEVKSENFYFNISFLPESPSFNNELLLADGYIFNYNPNKNKL